MISHPFEIKPSTTNLEPDVLMVTWRGTPSQSTAEFYLPAISSDTIIALADRLYGRHRLTATDSNTIQFPASDLALIPIPAGAGRYAGLLSVAVHPSMAEGTSFTVSVRQLAAASATARKPPPAPPEPKVASARAESLGSEEQRFLWRQARGGFQYTVTAKSEKLLLSEQERLVAWLKWRIEIIPATSRWKPVLLRYLKYTGNLVWSLGKDPTTIRPSEVGSVTGDGAASNWPIAIHGKHECTGKIEAIHYDRFGDFRGFVIRTESGRERLFRASEPAIENLVLEAWEERTVVRVAFDEHGPPETPECLTLLRAH